MSSFQRHVPVTVLCLFLIIVSLAVVASASASASATLVAAVPLTQSASADGHEWSSPTKPLHVGGIRVTYTGWVEVDVHAHGYETLRNLKVYVRHWPSNETRIAHINVLPAGEHVTVTLPHPPFPLSFPCNLFGVVVQKHSGHAGGGYRRRPSTLAKIEAHEITHARANGVRNAYYDHEFATYTRALFRICQLSSAHLQPAVRQTTCSAQCAHEHAHGEWFHCCARSLHKECAVACCKAEQRYVEVPQCCIVQRNRSSVSEYVDHFRSVSYRNSNGETDWRQLPWQEKPAFLPFIKLMGDDNPRTGRIRVSEEKDALQMQCGGTDGCTAGCVFGVPMYVRRHLRVPACHGESQLTVEMHISYHIEKRGKAGHGRRRTRRKKNSKLDDHLSRANATFTLYALDGTVLHHFAVAPKDNAETPHAPTKYTFNVSTTADPPSDVTYIIEFHVPVIGCGHKRALKFSLHSISVKAKCEERDVECPARTDVCGVCEGDARLLEVCDDG